MGHQADFYVITGFHFVSDGESTFGVKLSMLLLTEYS